MTRVAVRNAVVVLGAWYLASYLLVPGVIVVDWMIGRWNLYVPMPAVWLTGALVAGVIAAWLIDSERPSWWAGASAVFVFLATYSSYRWYQPPTISQRAGQVAASSLAAAGAALALMYFWRKWRRNATAV